MAIMKNKDLLMIGFILVRLPADIDDMFCRLRNDAGFFHFAFAGIDADSLWDCFGLHKNLASLGDITQFLVAGIRNKRTEG